MAVPSTAIWEIQTGGSDPSNGGGGFNPAATFATDGAATLATGNAPVFTSASYTFVAGDAGAYLFIKSGTNWTPGWYPISSVSGGAATIDATLGTPLKYDSTFVNIFMPTTVAGCATTASPTAGSWSVDYSQQTSARTTLTAATAAGAGSTITDASIGKNWVGNTVQITSGTNATAGTYYVNSTSSTTATLDRAVTTGVTSNAAGNMGGCAGSPGFSSASWIGSNYVWVKSGTYSVTTTSTAVSNGLTSYNQSDMRIRGYQTKRGDDAARPLIQASGIASVSLWQNSAASQATGYIRNFTFDGASLTGMTGLNISDNEMVANCRFLNCPTNGILGRYVVHCYASNCGTGFNLSSAVLINYDCEATGCNVGFNAVTGHYCRCIAWNNTSHGFASTGDKWFVNCVASGNGGSGFSVLTTVNAVLVNCIASGNTLYGFTSDAARFEMRIINCAGYSNTSGNYNTTHFGALVENFQNLTGNPFTNAASGDFSLNNTAGAGVACRAAGIPGAFPGGTTTSYLDIGAVQHQDSGGGLGMVMSLLNFGIGM